MIQATSRTATGGFLFASGEKETYWCLFPIAAVGSFIVQDSVDGSEGLVRKEIERCFVGLH